MLLGVIAGSAGQIVLRAKNSDAWNFPSRFHHPIARVFSLVGLSACIGAIITSLVVYGLTWYAVTIAEIALCAMIAAALPRAGQALAVITSPITIPFILGRFGIFGLSDWSIYSVFGGETA